MVNNNNNNNICGICKSQKGEKRCPISCSFKSCKNCHNEWNRRSGECAGCRARTRPPVNEQRRRIIAAARRARQAVARGARAAFQEPVIEIPPHIARMHRRSGSTSPPPRVIVPNNRGRRSAAPSPESPRPMHTGGLVRKTGVHRLLKDEIVLSRAQRNGFTHGQIVKILKAYKKSKKTVARAT